MKYSKNICIWCLKEKHDKDVEHIFPESLGCPDFMTLPGSIVCKKCNNELASLDRAILDEFDFLTFYKGIKRKNNKKPEITSRGNIIAKHTENSAKIFLNAEKYKITLEDGTQLTPYKSNGRSVQSDITIKDNVVSISMTLDFGQGKKFVRGLTKTAINCFVYSGGYDTVISTEFNKIREYVKHGGAKRKAIVLKAPDNEYKLAIETIATDENQQYIAVIRIGTVYFIIDLSPDGLLIEQICKKAMSLYGKQGWSIIPQ